MKSTAYWNYYFGYGLLDILTGLIKIIMYWMLSYLAKDGSKRVKPMIALFFVANVMHAILLLKYFLLTPVLFDVPVALLLGFAYFTSPKAHV